MKSRLGGFLNNDSHSPVKWGIDRSPSKDKFIGRKALASWDMNSKIVGTSMDLEKMYLRLTTVRKPFVAFISQFSYNARGDRR